MTSSVKLVETEDYRGEDRRNSVPRAYSGDPEEKLEVFAKSKHLMKDVASRLQDAPPEDHVNIVRRLERREPAAFTRENQKALLLAAKQSVGVVRESGDPSLYHIISSMFFVPLIFGREHPIVPRTACLAAFHDTPEDTLLENTVAAMIPEGEERDEYIGKLRYISRHVENKSEIFLRKRKLAFDYLMKRPEWYPFRTEMTAAVLADGTPQLSLPEDIYQELLKSEVFASLSETEARKTILSDAKKLGKILQQTNYDVPDVSKIQQFGCTSAEGNSNLEDLDYAGENVLDILIRRAAHNQHRIYEASAGPLKEKPQIIDDALAMHHALVRMQVNSYELGNSVRTVEDGIAMYIDHLAHMQRLADSEISDAVADNVGIMVPDVVPTHLRPPLLIYGID